jgi:predicted nucleic acid-binding protein
MKRKNALITLLAILIIIFIGSINYIKLIEDNKITLYHSHEIKSELEKHTYNEENKYKSYNLKCKCDDNILEIHLYSRR